MGLVLVEAKQLLAHVQRDVVAAQAMRNARARVLVAKPRRPLFISAFSYLGMARWEYRMRWAQTREIGNQTIRAKTFEQRLETHEQQAASRPTRSQSRATRATGAGRATGAANNTEPDIAELDS